MAAGRPLRCEQAGRGQQEAVLAGLAGREDRPRQGAGEDGRDNGGSTGLAVHLGPVVPCERWRPCEESRLTWNQFFFGEEGSLLGGGGRFFILNVNSKVCKQYGNVADIFFNT